MADTPDFDAILKAAQDATNAAMSAMQAQQRETQIVMAAIASADPHDRQLCAMILANPDLKTAVEAAVATWFRSKTNAPAGK
jgi:hypothetical protein